MGIQENDGKQSEGNRLYSFPNLSHRSALSTATVGIWWTAAKVKILL
jgi:hypothetical protein